MQGKTIIVTFNADSDNDFVRIAKAEGANVVCFPMIQIVPLGFSLANDISYFSWIVFTSKNGVETFFTNQNLHKNNKIAVIGDGTASALQKYGQKPSFVGLGKTGSLFSEELKHVIEKGENVLLVLGKMASNTVYNQLSAVYSVTSVVTYDTQMPNVINQNVVSIIANEKYDLIIFASPSAVDNFITAVGIKNIKAASIGPVTTKALHKHKITPKVTAHNHCFSGLAEAVSEFLGVN